MSIETDIMIEIIKQMADILDCESVVNYNCSKLWFNFRYGSLMLEVECPEEKEDKYRYNRLCDIDIEGFCTDVKIGRLYVTNPTPYSDDNDRAYEGKHMQMFQLVKSIKADYPNAIEDYYVKDFLMDSYIMEGENVWSSFFIQIADNYKKDKCFISNVIGKLETKLYSASAIGLIPKAKDIASKYELSILTTNTKVRRLGYFKLMLSIFKEKPLMMEKPFMNKVSSEAVQHEEELLKYKNSKGIIKQTKLGVGVKPYVEVALGMKLINRVGNGYEQGKVSRAYNALRHVNASLFEMSTLDKAFFLENILRYDYLYISSILEYAYISIRPSYGDLKKVYQQVLLKNLRLMLEEANKSDNIKKYTFLTIEQRIKDWKKPEVYLEHVLMPRLNWLYDLDLISLSDSLSFELTLEGERLFRAICEWQDIAGTEVVDSSPYLDASFMKLFDEVYGCKMRKNIELEDEDRRLTQYLDESFSLFKTFTPNRVTFSVFASYAKWKLYQEASCAIDTDDLVGGFLKRNADKYIFKFQKFYNDGYIQKIKH